MFAGEHRGGGASGNTRSSNERGRVSAYGDYPDSMDNPSSREDISEMYVRRGKIMNESQNKHRPPQLLLIDRSFLFSSLGSFSFG